MKLIISIRAIPNINTASLLRAESLQKDAFRAFCAEGRKVMKGG